MKFAGALALVMVGMLAVPATAGTIWAIDFTEFTVNDPDGLIASVTPDEVVFDGSGRYFAASPWHLYDLSVPVPATAVEMSFAVETVGDASAFLVYVNDVDPGEEGWALRGSMSRVGETVPGRVVFNLLTPSYNPDIVDLPGGNVSIYLRYVTNDSTVGTHRITLSNMVFQDFHSTAPSPSLVPLPPAAWMGLGLLGGIGLIRRLWRRSA